MGATTASRATSASRTTAPRTTSASRATSPKTRNKKNVQKTRESTGENGGVRGGENILKNTGEKDVPSLRDLIREDAEAAFRRDPSADSVSDITRFSVGFKIVRAYRRQHWLYEHGHRALALWLAMRSRIKYGADIHPAARIGRRFTIDHGIGVVIGGTAIIGDDCLMYQGATLGMTGKHGGKRHPTLGNGVMIGAGSILLGTINVGDGAYVGAGSVVVDDVPANTTVVGNPARVVRTHACPLVSDVIRVTDDFGKTWIMEA